MGKNLAKYKTVLQDAPITIAIIAINIAIYIALNTIPNLANQLLLDTELKMIQQKPWTLVTVFFSQQLHIHLLLNMGLLFVFGRELEKNIGSVALLSTYMVCGILGSLTFPFFAPIIDWTGGSVVGASAAVWGVVAAVAVLLPNIKFGGYAAKYWTLALFVGNAIIFIMNPDISIGAAAHVAGIIAGLVCGYWLKRYQY
ncbi:rhomboid family intramembrane serine protease [Desulfuribacillus alkaliarsenatis]|uniref:Rhomboid family intramembrane serine protease n=1 Tax=Desulfuribacillus alkaliarsenatis TaxID=766136 RepID=A0A1E5G250_9FIRM|nr:rhomboid family intramembrane serine protease [Desulfuribacillus alkaliarsenatis]OEF97055.1 rhomboid family intramembrane serine protease [Desulfuribacillus alkaliarsenatis]